MTWNWFGKIPEQIVQAFSDGVKDVFDNFDWDTLKFKFEGIDLSEQSVLEDEGDHAKSSQSPSPPSSSSPNHSRKGCIKCVRLVVHWSATEVGLSDSNDFPIMEAGLSDSSDFPIMELCYIYMVMQLCYYT
ncbi:uncharacterized protein LAESUDRAFT_717879 [Laetiporus sulphureus 93-53]|uniref:Uncharacterized protein n=1 Tax=Laetiporus sulphureus 93-53 TaxID=1314785 RepID=A0A165BEA8_9APHY|nr:uncharacterized protein LAESUDRAFT_717879 [Laetiporus sulphureus 93-53]KZT00865.1 hypothetical protein LAESUDRAFT_717879 [Laetiporus sulphureus 93-53]